LYITLVWPKLKYASVVWNSISMMDSSKLETVQRKVAALCYSIFFVGVCCNIYEDILARLNIWTLYSTWQHLDALFLIFVFKNIFHSISVIIPTMIIIDCSTFVVNHNFILSPSAGCVSAVNDIFKDIDIFNKDYILLTDTL
jgi:hypothetical protein